MKKATIHGIHGTLFYQLEFKKRYYPTKKNLERIEHYLPMESNADDNT